MEPPCPAWIPWALIWIPPHRHCWSMSQVSLALWRGPSGGGVRGKQGQLVMLLQDIMAKHKLFFWELNVHPCVYHESCRLLCLACAYYIPSGMKGDMEELKARWDELQQCVGSRAYINWRLVVGIGWICFLHNWKLPKKTCWRCKCFRMMNICLGTAKWHDQLN